MNECGAVRTFGGIRFKNNYCPGANQDHAIEMAIYHVILWTLLSGAVLVVLAVAVIVLVLAARKRIGRLLASVTLVYRQDGGS